MNFTRIAASCLLCAALSACAAGRQAADGGAGVPALADLAGRTYYLVAMDGQSCDDASAPELGFTGEGRVVGRACNRFSGAARIVNGTLTATALASTRMACAQPFLNELEQTLFGMLGSGARIRLDGGRLTLDRDGHELVYALPSPKP
ncbi:MAG: META domain-containing protein [Deltaproteobacteria bacterium]|jgi:heat shock protein HslJ|nr:META domain-containing protein [Deltaproteobacteria bacterium]